MESRYSNNDHLSFHTISQIIVRFGIRDDLEATLFPCQALILDKNVKGQNHIANKCLKCLFVTCAPFHYSLDGATTYC